MNYFWALGVQCVPLDLQAMDHKALAYEGRFRQINGGVGYVLRPKPAHSFGGLAPPQIEFSVNLLSAHYLPLSNEYRNGNQTSLMCVVRIHGTTEDSGQGETMTKMIKTT